MIEELIKQGYLRSPEIIKAFQKVKREDFLPPEMKVYAQIDQALPIGYGQTISQPLVVAFMLEELQPQLGQIVLDIGTGSGWTSALLAEIIGPQGKVLSIEIVPQLHYFGKENAEKLGYKNIEFRLGNWQKAVKSEEKFDRIQAAATAKNLPKKLIEHLKSPGRLVIPVQKDESFDHLIKTIIKDKKGAITEINYPGFSFVPLVDK